MHKLNFFSIIKQIKQYVLGDVVKKNIRLFMVLGYAVGHLEAMAPKIVNIDDKMWLLKVFSSQCKSGWVYDQRVLLWDYNEKEALRNCDKPNEQSVDTCKANHFYPLVIEQLYLGYAIRGEVPIDERDKHRGDICYYWPGSIDFNCQEDKSYRVYGFFESTFNAAGNVLYHRCFHEDKLGDYRRCKDYSKNVYTLIKKGRDNWHDYCKKDFNGDLYKEEHKKVVAIFIPSLFQCALKYDSCDVNHTYLVNEVVTNHSDCAVPCIEIVDKQKPDIRYTLYTPHVHLEIFDDANAFNNS